MTVLSPPYDLPPLRPMRAILTKPRIQGCAIVMENGCISSENWDGSEGWQIGGDGTTSFPELDADLAQLQIDLDLAEAAVNTLTTVTIPALQAELDVTQTELDAAELAVIAAQAEVDAAEAAINTLTTVTIPALDARLDTAEGEIDTAQIDLDAAEAAIVTLNTTTLPALQSELDASQVDIDAAEAAIVTLNTTTIPALDTRLDQAEIDVAAAQAEVSAILPIETADISPGAITAPLLAANSVIAGKIAAGTIVAADIAANTITSAEIAADAITTSELAAGAVTAGNIAAGTIVAADIATGTITANELAADSVTTSELAAGAVTAVKIAAGTITAAQIAGDTITANELAADSVTASEIAANAVTANEIAALAVTTAKLDALAVTAAKIAANTITAAQIAGHTITAAEIAADTITANEIGADQVTANEIAALTITAAEIAAGTITADKLQANTLTANEIGADAITANELAAINIGVGKFIASTSYVPGVSGWSINAAGDVEFNDGTFRGEIDASALNITISELDDGSIEFFSSSGALVGRLAPASWEIGDLDTPGLRATLDPIGGLRMRGETDQLLSLVDQLGLSVRDEDTGLIASELSNKQLLLSDPGGTGQLTMTARSTAGLSTPRYSQTLETAPGSSVVAPGANPFTANDLDLLHAAVWKRATVQAATWTPPAGFTESLDTKVGSESSLAVTVATKQPAAAVGGTFTSSQSNWDHAVGSHIVVKAASGATPSVRSSSSTNQVTAATAVNVTLTKPAGTAAGDVMVIFISLGNNGGTIPLGWTTPDGWRFMGAKWGLTGTGASTSMLAVGIWARLAGASEPATYDTNINFGAGTKTIHATMYAIQNAASVAGGSKVESADSLAIVAPTDFRVTAGGRTQQHLEEPVGCVLTRSASQSIANNAWAAIAWNVETRDSYTMHSIAANTDRIWFETDGSTFLTDARLANFTTDELLLLIYFQADFAGHATGQRGIRVQFWTAAGASVAPVINGDLKRSVSAASNHRMTIMVPVCPFLEYPTASYFTCEVFQDSGAALDVVPPVAKAYYCWS